MENAWIAGAFGLGGSIIGGTLALIGVWLTNRNQRRLRLEDLARERVAVEAALLAELESLGRITLAKASAMRRVAAAGADRPVEFLRNELISTPYFLSKLGDRISCLQPDFIVQLASALALCEIASAAATRWVAQGGTIPSTGLEGVAGLFERAGARCTEASDWIRSRLGE